MRWPNATRRTASSNKLTGARLARMYAGYRRVSRVGERDERLRSPEFQAERIAGAAAVERIEVELLPPELDVSGGKEERAILDAAIARVERGELEGIVVAQLDRLSRLSMGRALALLDRIESAGGRVVSAAEPLDPSTPEGRFQRNVLLAVAEMERNRKAAGFDTAKRAAIERGSYIGLTPTGYLKGADGRLVPDPVLAPTVRDLFLRRAAGESWRKLSERLAAKLGRGVNYQTVMQMLRNPAYRGVARQGRYVNEHAHQPLVSRAEWEAAQLTRARPPRGTRPPALLAGVVRCAGCGRSMYTTTGGRGHRYYRCGRMTAGGECPAPARIAEAVVEPFVSGVVLSAASSEGPIAEAPETLLQTAVIELGEAEQLLSDYRRPEVQRALDVVAWSEGLAERQKEVDRLRRKVGEAQGQVATVPVIPKLAEMWPNLSPDERRTLIAAAVGIVWVWKGTAEVSKRVRVIARGFEPDNLPSRGNRTPNPVVTLDWDSHLPGELRMPVAEDAEVSTS